MTEPSEFEGIFAPQGTRKPMSRPPEMLASRGFIREVAEMVADRWPDSTAVADWIAGKMERFGARTAQPVFDMDGSGPICSWCGAFWPLCGHHHLSEVLDESEEDQ